jgi:phosphomannomutase
LSRRKGREGEWIGIGEYRTGCARDRGYDFSDGIGPSMAIMMLYEEAKIGLDDKLTKYIPESPAAWKEVTIRQLLTHTSGIAD